MPAEESRIVCNIDTLLASRGMSLTQLADLVGLSIVNLSILKNNRAKAVRFTTLTALCDALQCTPGELFTVSEPPR